MRKETFGKVCYVLALISGIIVWQVTQSVVIGAITTAVLCLIIMYTFIIKYNLLLQSYGNLGWGNWVKANKNKWLIAWYTLLYIIVIIFVLTFFRNFK